MITSQSQTQLPLSDERQRYCEKRAINPVPDTLDVKIWDEIKNSFQLDKKINLSYNQLHRLYLALHQRNEL